MPDVEGFKVDVVVLKKTHDIGAELTVFATYNCPLVHRITPSLAAWTMVEHAESMVRLRITVDTKRYRIEPSMIRGIGVQAVLRSGELPVSFRAGRDLRFAVGRP